MPFHRKNGYLIPVIMSTFELADYRLSIPINQFFIIIIVTYEKLIKVQIVFVPSTTPILACPAEN